MFPPTDMPPAICKAPVLAPDESAIELIITDPTLKLPVIVENVDMLRDTAFMLPPAKIFSPTPKPPYILKAPVSVDVDDP